MAKKKRKSNTPRRLRMKRAGRLQSAKSWLPTYSGKNLVRGYSKHFGVDLLCAVRELEMLGVSSDPKYVEQLKINVQNKQRMKEKKRLKRQQEEEFFGSVDQDINYQFIVGYTPNGFPYGITWDEYYSGVYEDRPEEYEREPEVFDYHYKEDYYYISADTPKEIVGITWDEYLQLADQEVAVWDQEERYNAEPENYNEYPFDSDSWR